MRHLRTSGRAVLGLGAVLLIGCSERALEPLTGPSLRSHAGSSQKRDVRAAIAAQQRHMRALLRIPGVVGTAVGLRPNGKVAVRIFLERAGVAGLPSELDGVPVAAQVTGRLMAFSDPTTRQRPAPIGYSVGHPSITAGSIGARVVDGSGRVYVLSNNHVLANSNDAAIGDPALQPGPYDHGTAPDDQIGTLAAFKPIDFSFEGANTFDAAIALSNASDLGNATPDDSGYGAPSSTIFGDASGDGMFDDPSALLGLAVQKYGRTTGLTKGQITGINATVDVCYEVFIFFCVKSARYVDQLVIEPGAFSGGGDSGSLIVTDDESKSPVALLFAGGATETVANRIDLVLSYFGVRVDGGSAAPPPPPPPPPGPVTDVAITAVGAPASVTQGASVSVAVTVKNVGDQDVAATFDVSLEDATDHVALGTQSVPGLAPGAATTLTFSWNTAGSTPGRHTLSARHALADDNAANDQASTGVLVNAPSTGMHVGDLDALPLSSGNTWSATVEITVHDANHQPMNGATVVGSWSVSGLNSNTCTTGDLGGDGSCIVTFPSLRKRSVTFTVTGVTAVGHTYQSDRNHDVDRSSNGTSIRVVRP